MKKLRIVRIIAGIFVLSVTIAAFLLPERRGGAAILQTVGSLQLFPGLTRQVALGGAFVLGLFFVVALTLVAGRVYCSVLCPLGLFQDVVIRIRRRFGPKLRYKYRKPTNFLHLGLTAAVVIVAFAGSMTAVNLLEPFSTFGRIMTMLGMPLLASFNNAANLVLSRMGVYLLSHTPLGNVTLAGIAGAIISAGVLATMSYRWGRLFCNTLCPAGALLNILSRVSIFRIRFNNESCKGCGICERACKSRCIDTKSRTIDWSACVGCYNCLAVCPTDGFRFNAGRSKVEVVPLEKGRRDFLNGAVTALVVPLAAKSEEAAAKPSVPGYDEARNLPVVPPGSHSRGRFTNLCTACHACVSACPSKVMRPAFIEYGLAGVFQPRLDYSHGYCVYECTTCGSVCPSGAIEVLPKEEKKLTQIGVAIFVKQDCVVETKHADCGACSEHCPTKAVKMVPYGRLVIPEVTEDLCIGCGSCEHACPTVPRKAIYVVARDSHQRAKPPKKETMEKGFDSTQEFPF